MRSIVIAAVFAVVLSAEARAQTQSPAQLALPKGPPLFSLYEALGSPENWTIKGTLRPRYEILGGQFRPAPAPRSNELFQTQTAVFAEYNAGPVRFGAEMFDSRAYFQRRGSSSIAGTEVNALELAQAYAAFDLKDTFGEGTKSGLVGGRMTLNVGSRRLISRQQYRNTTNAYTGLAFDWQNAEKDKLRLFWLMPHTRLPEDRAGLLANEIVWDRESTDVQLYGGTFTKSAVLGGTFEIYGYGLQEQDSAAFGGFQTRNRRLFTPGLRLFRAPSLGTFDYEFEGIYQTGLAHETAAVTDTRDLRVSAGFVHAEVGYTFNTYFPTRVALQYDYGSGDDSNPNTYTRFDTLYGARRFEYGPTGIYGPVQRSNLSSPGVRLELMPHKDWDFFAEYRLLYLANATDSFAFTGVRDRTGGSGNFAGQQLEGRVRHWLIPDTMRVDVGTGYLIKGDFLRNAPNAPRNVGDSIYGYLETTIFF